MKPTVTIVQYLYSGGNTWLRHGEDCTCPVERRIAETLDQVAVDLYLCINGNVAEFVQRTEDEWNEICGPVAENRVLDTMIESHMNQVAEIMAVQATKERLSSE